MPKIFLKLVLLIIALVLLFVLTKPLLNKEPDSTEHISPTENSDSENEFENYPPIVLDAGHGGFDPGKVGVDGQLEKDINLSIVLKVEKLLKEKGIKVHLTRNSDKLLSDPTSKSKKKDDMIARIELIEKINPLFTISVHQNSFTDDSVSGPQVFYCESSSDSANMATIMQDILNQQLEPIKNRDPQANNNYYLLTRTPTPTIIVECGFLSNPSEAKLLSQDAYQDKIANSIYLGILACYEAMLSQTPAE